MTNRIDEQLKAKIEALARQLPIILKETGQTVPVDVTNLINTNFNPGAKTRNPLAATWSNSEKLNHYQTLARSFLPGEPGSLSEIRTTNTGVDVTLGSGLPYAAVHEFGGFIKSKGKMQNYFWAMYYKSKTENPFFRAMALSVAKKGGVTMPARPYFHKAIEEFEQKRLTSKLDEVFTKILEYF